MSALRVVHEMRGRLRVRVPPDVDLPGLAEAVSSEPGVLSATCSPRTRGLLVVYEPETQSAAALKDAIARHGGVELSHAAPPVPSALESTRHARGSALHAAVRDGVSELDQRVQRATRGLMGLSGLLPLALSTWAVGQIVRGRANPLAWSSALWYAHSLFRDYSPPAPRE
jgi:hypothetical protein